MLMLRPFQKQDETAVVELLLEPRVKETYMIPDLTGREAQKLFLRFMELSRQADRFVRAVCLDGKVIGWINDTEIADSAVELGWVIAPAYWNNGYATEAVRAAIATLHREGFDPVYAAAFEENKASLRVMQKAGMRLMDKTEQLEYRGKLHNCIYYESRL